MPTVRVFATVAYMRLGLLGATATSAWTTPSPSPPGRPLVSWRQVVPPSVDLNMPPPVPDQTPFSHGPWRSSQRQAYTVFGSLGSNSRSEAPVFSSFDKTFSNV